MTYVAAFGRFWWDFIVGDDWRAALGLLIAFGASGLLVSQEIVAWWLLPLAVVGLLAESLRRATRDSS